MSYSSNFQAFLEDKDFILKLNAPDVETIKNTKKNYVFLSENRQLLEQEFETLFTSLQKNKEKDDRFWFYCLYCSLMLKTYHEAYGNGAKAAEYNSFALKIEAHFEQNTERSIINKPSFISKIKDSLIEGMKDLVTTPIHSSKVKGKIGLLNLYRIYWTFCRIYLTSAFLLANEWQLIEKLSKLLHKTINVDNIIKALEAPNAAMRALSVGFFLARLVINTGLVIKHTAFPSGQENDLDWKIRFCDEIKKRHPEFLNDIVWATINGITNYASIFRISAPAAGWITAGFLFFDVSLLLWKRHLAHKDYLIKKAQYHCELEQAAGDIVRQKIIHQQLEELETSWTLNSQRFLFNATGALLLGLGFTASLLFTPGVLVVAAYAVCVIGLAIYLSEGAYNNYNEKRLQLERASVHNEDTSHALAEYRSARNDFILTFAKNIILPSLLIATFAICWQAALVLTAAYLAYELYSAYSNHKKENEALELNVVPA